VKVFQKYPEKYFSEVLFIMLYKIAQTFESVDEILSVSITIKTTEQYFPVVLVIMLNKVVLTFGAVDEILKFDYSNESY